MPMFHFGMTKRKNRVIQFDGFERKVKCELCDFTTVTFKELKEHKADIHAY